MKTERLRTYTQRERERKKEKERERPAAGNIIAHRLSHLPVPRAVAQHLPGLVYRSHLELAEALDVDLTVVLLELALLARLILGLIRRAVEEVVHTL